MERPTAKSLVLDLLSTLGRGSLPVRTLVGAAALFGIAENNLRVALARLLAAKLVERDERGQYRLGTAADAVRGHVVSWRRLGERLRPWSGLWIAVHGGGGPRAARTAHARRARALRLLGFRPLAPALAVRPDNLAGGVPAVRERLHDLGLEHDALVVALGELDARTEARARRLWDRDALVAGYRTTRAALERSARRLPRLAPEAAMAESFLLGGRAIRQLVVDPLLPEPLVAAAERTALVDAMTRYDRAGRACWAAFMRADAGIQRSASSARVVGAPGHLAASGDIA